MATTYAVVGASVEAEMPDRLSGVVDPDRIADQIRDIVERMGVVFTHPLGLPLKTMEIGLTITAEGSVGFLGTGGKLTGEGSITLTFERADAD